MHIKYEIFEDRNEGDFCKIEKAQVETCTLIVFNTRYTHFFLEKSRSHVWDTHF